MQKSSSAEAVWPQDGADEQAERRQHPRHEVAVSVVVDIDDERYEFQMSNVGSGGAFLTPSLDVDVGRQVKLTPRDARVCATADVLRVDGGGIGIRFEDKTLGAIVTGWSRRVCDE